MVTSPPLLRKNSVTWLPVNWPPVRVKVESVTWMEQWYAIYSPVSSLVWQSGGPLWQPEIEATNTSQLTKRTHRPLYHRWISLEYTISDYTLLICSTSVPSVALLSLKKV